MAISQETMNHFKKFKNLSEVAISLSYGQQFYIVDPDHNGPSCYTKPLTYLGVCTAALGIVHVESGSAETSMYEEGNLYKHLMIMYKSENGNIQHYFDDDLFVFAENRTLIVDKVEAELYYRLVKESQI